MKVQIADSDEKIMKCKEALLEFRSHIAKHDYFAILKQMLSTGSVMIFIEEDNRAVAVSIFETGYKLHRGNYLYVDDLTTLPDYRKKGYAGKLMDWIFEYAKTHKIEQIHLDSGVQRFDAHRFYLSRGFIISSHHFVMK